MSSAAENKRKSLLRGPYFTVLLTDHFWQAIQAWQWRDLRQFCRTKLKENYTHTLENRLEHNTQFKYWRSFTLIPTLPGFIGRTTEVIKHNNIKTKYLYFCNSKLWLIQILCPVNCKRKTKSMAYKRQFIQQIKLFYSAENKKNNSFSIYFFF